MKIHSLKVIAATSLTIVLSACAGTPEVAQVNCAGPKSRNLEQAVDQVKSRLSHVECADEFASYFEELLVIGEGDPAVGNKALYREFIAWSHRQGLIGKQQGKTLYTRHFHRNFVTLPDEYNNCAAVCPDQAALERELKGELFSKHRGAVRILGDKEAYRQIDADYNGVLLLLDATCQACDDGRQS